MNEAESAVGQPPAALFFALFRVIDYIYTMQNAEFHTIGCKLNQTETAGIKDWLASRGWAAENQAEEPQLIFVNTCAVTSRAAAKSRQLVARLGRAHPEALIVAAGCLAQLDPDSLQNLPGVRYILGTERRHQIDEWLGQAGIISPDSSSPADEGIQNCVAVDRHRARPFIKIQDGCDHGCSFCIIPRLRGAPRSFPLEPIIAAAASLHRAGAEEVVLTGVRIGAWGRELSGAPNLTNLLEHLLSLPAPLRIRMGSLEPWEVTEGLVEFVLSHPRICPHFHIPLQHTVPSLLERMGRPGIDEIREILSTVERVAPFTGIGADIITGFPGETDADFRQLVADLEALPLSYLHIFSFSPRPGTAAERFKPRVPDSVVKERAQTLVKLNRRKKAAFASRQLGRWLRAIPDHKRLDGKWTQAVTENYLHIALPVQDIRPGRQTRVALAFQPDVGFIGQPM